MSAVATILKEVADFPCVTILALDDEMLNLANELALSRLVHRIALRASSFRMPLEISDGNVSPTI